MPKVIDHDQRRQDILLVTWNLITEGGLEVATMREIARRAGFANGALKHYFPGKDDIIRGTFQMALDSMSKNVVSAVADQRGLAALNTMCQATLPLDEDGVAAARVLLSFWERAVTNPALNEVYLEHLSGWSADLTRYLNEGREDGDILTPTPNEEIVNEIVLMNMGAIVMSLVSPSMHSPELHRQHVAALMARLRQPGV